MLDPTPHPGPPDESELIRTLEKRLAKAEEQARRWKSLVESPFDTVLVADRDAVLQYVSRFQFGFTAETVVGKMSVYEFIPPDQHEEVRQTIAAVFETGEPGTYEVYANEPVDRWYLCLVSPFETTGEVDTVSIQSRDITPQKVAEEGLRESENRLQQLAENVDDCFYLVDIATRETLYISSSAEKVLGVTASDILADTRAYMRHVHASDLPDVQKLFQKLMTSGYPYGTPSEFRIIRNGEVRWVQHCSFAIRDDAGKVVRIAGNASDITERKRAEAELLEAEARYRKLLETLPVISYVAIPGEKRSVQYISPQIEWKLGYTQEEWTSDPDFWKSRIHPEDAPKVMRAKNALMQSGERLRLEYRILAKDDIALTVREEAAMVKLDGQEQAKIHGVLLDITEAADARVGEQRAQAASVQLVQVQEEERRHLARELHDEVGQNLMLLRMLLEAMDADDPQTRAEKLEQARGSVQGLISQVHDMALDLRPAMLDDLGLLPALIWLVQRVSNQTVLNIRFDHNGIDVRLESDIETCAYRIVQEALSNCARHAEASDVHVRLWATASTLNIQVEDKGVGFDTQEALGGHGTAGLIGMRERATAVGGSFELESSPGEGCCLVVQIPREKQDAL